MWCHTASCFVFPLVCPLHYPVALYKVHVISSSQLICSTLVYVQHCAPINVKLSKSTTLVAAWFLLENKGIHFQWTFTFECTFYNKRNWIIKTLHATNVFNICCVTFKNSHFYRPQKLLSFLDHSFTLFQGPLCWKGHYKKFWIFWPKPWVKPFGKLIPNFWTFKYSHIYCVKSFFPF